MGALPHDLHFALRMLRKSPAFTLVAILSLALAIGGTIAIFSVMYAMAFRPLPVAHPERLVSVEGQIVGGNRYSYAEWKLFREKQNIFASVAAFHDAYSWAGSSTIIADKQPQQVSSMYVSGEYFQTVGVTAAFGRVLQVSDNQPGAPPVCVLGYRLWRQLYGESKDALGQVILLDGHEFQIVGVAARSFTGVVTGVTTEIFMPLEAERTYEDYPVIYGKQTPSLDSDATIVSIIARLKPGMSASQASAGLRVLGPELAKALSPNSRDQTERSSSFAGTVARSMANGTSESWLQNVNVMLLLMVMAAVALVIACANLGNLLLARATTRQAEIATRLSLGATRWRLIRQLLTESIALALVGAAAGLLVERWATQALIWALSWPPDAMLSLSLSWDSRLVVFAVGITVFCALLFGLAPAIRATGVSIYSAMNNSVATGKRANRFSNSLLVVVQVALSMALLVSAGLLARTLHAFLTADLGYDPRGVLMVQPNWQGAGESPQRNAFVGEQLLRQFRSVPGVISASWSRPSSQMHLTRVTAHGAGNAERRIGSYNIFVSSDFFRTRRTPMLAGRDFNDGDTQNSLPVAILSKTMGETLFGNANPVGQRFHENDSNGKGPDYTVEIVGIASDMQYRRPDLGPLPIMYRPVSQCGDACLAMGGYEVRVAGGFPEMAKRLQSAASTVDAHIALKTGSLMDPANSVLHRNRAMAMIAVVFSLFVGLLAMIGVYGVTSYATSQRTREIGIRMALGAQPRNVFRMILGETITIVFVGIALGVAAGFAAAQMIRGMLWGVSASDPVSFGLAIGLMLFIAGIAAFLPARRAMRVDPMVALRYE
jgi:putative ABC transport system permease protein